MFGVTQFLSIFMIFLAISVTIGADGFVVAKVVPSCGRITISVGLILNIVALTFILDDV